MNNTLEDTVLTPDEVAEILKVSGSTVKRMMADGQLPFVQIRRSRRILLSEVQHLLGDAR
jgi:excisionase family DNA binding protein